jgi:hypothetical protein
LILHDSYLLWKPDPQHVWTPQKGVDQGQITGISIASGYPSGHFSIDTVVLYATLARYDEWRVIQLIIHRDIHSGTVSMEAKPIAGKPGQPGSFPQASSCTACESPTGTFVGPMCADPAVPNKLYVGTDAGLVVGTAKNLLVIYGMIGNGNLTQIYLIHG